MFVTFIKDFYTQMTSRIAMCGFHGFRTRQVSLLRLSFFFVNNLKPNLCYQKSGYRIIAN